MSQSPAHFATTHWTVVVSAGERDSPQSKVALEQLCKTYWPAVLLFVRRQTNSADEANDLTQEFFCRVLEKNPLAQAAQERGRFRTFLLAAVKNFLANERNRAGAIKRGGQATLLPLDRTLDDSAVNLEPFHDWSPERIYERQWTLTLLRVVLEKLRAEQRAKGKEQQFDRLKEFLTPSGQAEDYATIAAKLGMTADSARQSVHRLRKRYRELLTAEVLETIADPEELGDEIAKLFVSLQ